jgi:hypothetical protein
MSAQSTDVQRGFAAKLAVIRRLVSKRLKLSKTQRLVRCAWTRYSRENPRGSGYCEDQGVRIEQLTQWTAFGVPLWRRREVVRELMPHEWISSATLGSER